MTTANIGIDKLGQVAIAVSDLPRSVSFYRDTLGLRMLFEAPPGLAFFECGETRLMLTTRQGEAKDHKTSVLYYRVADIQHAAATLKERGVEFEREPQLAAPMQDHDLWIGFIRDPDDTLIGIMAEIKRG